MAHGGLRDGKEMVETCVETIINNAVRNLANDHVPHIEFGSFLNPWIDVTCYGQPCGHAGMFAGCNLRPFLSRIGRGQRPGTACRGEEPVDLQNPLEVRPPRNPSVGVTCLNEKHMHA